MAKKSLLDLKNARKPLQIKNMKRIIQDGVCPFCPEHIKKYHKPPILRADKHWVVTPNMYPYENVKTQILFISKKHIISVEDLSIEAWVALKKHLSWVGKKFDIQGGTLLMRFGDTSKTGATVSHLHAQVIVAKNAKAPVITRVG